MKTRKMWFLLGVAVLFGMAIMAVIDRWSVTPKVFKASTDPEIVVVADYPNQAVVEFILTEPIAPFYFVEEGDVKMREWLADPDEQKRWDPLNVGVDDALKLMDLIRQGVSGLGGGCTPNGISANGYTVRVNIIESHLGRKEEIIEQILEIIEDFEKDRSSMTTT